MGSILESFCSFFCVRLWMAFWTLRGGSAAEARVAGKGKGSLSEPVLEGSCKRISYAQRYGIAQRILRASPPAAGPLLQAAGCWLLQCSWLTVD